MANYVASYVGRHTYTQLEKIKLKQQYNSLGMANYVASYVGRHTYTQLEKIKLKQQYNS